MTNNIIPAVVIEPATPATASIIWLHGLGADGHDFEAVVPALSLPHNHGLRFVFPHAPYRPVTINNGYVMRAWYDIFDTSFLHCEDETGIKISSWELGKLIQHETDRGIVTNRILLAGFSQGGAISLYTGLRYTHRLGGILALSTYLPMMDKEVLDASTVNKNIPIMMAHGIEDTVVPSVLALQSRKTMEKSGFNIEWHSYPMGHSLCPEEITDISSWLSRVLEK